MEFSLAKNPKKLNQLLYMARVQGLKPKPNHLRPNFKVWFSILAELNSEFSLGLTKNALNQTKLNFGSTSMVGKDSQDWACSAIVEMRRRAERDGGQG